jgi:hypothetical protein
MVPQSEGKLIGNCYGRINWPWLLDEFRHIRLFGISGTDGLVELDETDSWPVEIRRRGFEVGLGIHANSRGLGPMALIHLILAFVEPIVENLSHPVSLPTPV